MTENKESQVEIPMTGDKESSEKEPKKVEDTLGSDNLQEDGYALPDPKPSNK